MPLVPLQVMDSVQTLDTGRRSAYDPDEIDEEQKERDVRNKVPHREPRIAVAGHTCHYHAAETLMGATHEAGSFPVVRAMLTHVLLVCTQINRQFQQFVKRVQADIWERDFGFVLLLLVNLCSILPLSSCFA